MYEKRLVKFWKISPLQGMIYYEIVSVKFSACVAIEPWQCKVRAQAFLGFLFSYSKYELPFLKEIFLRLNLFL